MSRNFFAGKEHDVPSKKRGASDEPKSQKSIICSDVPDDLNEKTFLLDHFTQFGSVRRIDCNTARGTCVVTFSDHLEAEMAKKNGGNLSPRHSPVTIRWCSGRSMTGMASDDKLPTLFGARLGQRNAPDEQPRQEVVREAKNEPSIFAIPIEEPKRATRSTTANDESLMKQLGQAAHSVGERLRVLEARDKLMKLRRTEERNLSQAQTTRGTCPDMCPEKERYLRCERSLLSTLELIPGSDGVMDPCRMVKEYARSSADQEHPLPHELRPPAVLAKTMRYLICHVMDMFEQQQTPPPLGEWYDFIWNRTRAIRKDITQQNLMADVECMKMVEKCARFHIYCSHALCEEEAGVFDPKINNENLTQCLQTLKYMYHDLRQKNVTCPHEGELMAYDIMLNLKEGSAKRQVQAMSPAVLSSPRVQFALSVLTAFETANYFRFFRLVASPNCTFLEACILHRYFDEVRTLACATFSRAFRKEDEIPLSYLVDILFMDDVENARAFLNRFGITVDGEMFRPPDLIDTTCTAPTREIRRSMRLIQLKRNMPLSMIVNNGVPVNDDWPQYVPHDSFTPDGVLRPSAYDASDQSNLCLEFPEPPQTPQTPIATFSFTSPTSAPIQTTFTLPRPPESVKQPPSLHKDPRVIETVSERVIGEILESVCDGNMADIARREYARAAILVHRVVPLLTQRCLDNIIGELCRHVATECLNESMSRHEMLQQCQKKAIERVSAQLIGLVVVELSTEISQECYAEARDRKQNEIAVSLLDVVVEETVSKLCENLSRSEMENAIKNKLAFELKRKCILRRAWNKWRDCVQGARFAHMAQEAFPAFPSPCDVTSGARIRSRMSLTNMARNYERLRSETDAALVSTLLSEETEWTPIGLSGLLQQLNCPRQPKFVVVVPRGQCMQRESGLQLFVSKILAQFSVDDSTLENGQLGKYCEDRWCVYVASDAILDSISKEQLRGTTCFIAVAAQEISSSKIETWLGAKANKMCPKPALVMLKFKNGLNEAISADKIADNEFYAVKRISASSQDRVSSLLRDAITWSLNNISEIPKSLKRVALFDFLRCQSQRLFFEPIVRSQRMDEYFVPEFISIWEAYNSLVDHLSATASSSSLLKFTFPALEMHDSEFCRNWNFPERLATLFAQCQSIALPKWDVTEEVTPDSVLGCIGQIPDSIPLCMRVERIVRGERETWTWLDVIYEIHCTLLNSFELRDHDTGEAFVAYYLEEELISFEMPDIRWDQRRAVLNDVIEDAIQKDAIVPSMDYGVSLCGGDLYLRDLENALEKQRRRSNIFTEQLIDSVSPALTDEPELLPRKRKLSGEMLSLEDLERSLQRVKRVSLAFDELVDKIAR